MRKNNDDLQDRLDEFLDKIVTRNEGARRKQQEREAEDNVFLEAFRTVRDQIEPVLAKARIPFELRGLPSNVRKTDNANASSISLTLEPETGGHANLTYAAVVPTRQVRVRRSVSHIAEGSVRLYAGDTPLGEFGLKEITPGLVESHVNDLLQDMIGDPS